MDQNYMNDYFKIIRGYDLPPYEYLTPEHQGQSIKRCSILKETAIEYSNFTTLNYGCENAVMSSN